MKNYISEGNLVPNLVAPSGGVVSGQGYVIGASMFVIADQTVAAGGLFTGATRGLYTLPVDQTVTIAAGDIAYWNATNSNVTNVATSNKLIGAFPYAQAAAAALTIPVNVGASHLV